MNKLSILLVLAFISCGKAPSLPEPTKGRSFSPLTGKSKAEILDLKYNNDIDLKCELRLQEGKKVDLTKAPTDEFVWKITSELSALRILNYKIGNKELIIVVKVTSDLKISENLTHVNERKQEFHLQYSPVLTVNFRRALKTILTNGSVHHRDSFESVDLYENIPSRLLTMTTEEYDEVVTEDVRCTLVTKINPAYADQWVRVK